MKKVSCIWRIFKTSSAIVKNFILRFSRVEIFTSFNDILENHFRGIKLVDWLGGIVQKLMKLWMSDFQAFLLFS